MAMGIFQTILVLLAYLCQYVRALDEYHYYDNFAEVVDLFDEEKYDMTSAPEDPSTPSPGLSSTDYIIIGVTSALFGCLFIGGGVYFLYTKSSKKSKTTTNENIEMSR